MTLRETIKGLWLGVVSAVVFLMAGGAVAQVKPAGKDEKKVALVVGVQDYEVDRLKLLNARKDAQEIAKVLREIGFKVHLVTDPNREELGSTVAAFDADLDQADIGMFFYSGHGMQTVRPGSVEASNLLLPRDFRVPQVTGAERVAQMERSTVALEDIIKQLRNKARVGVVFLDACRDNPFAAEELAAAQAEAATGGPARKVALSRGLSRTEVGTPSAALAPTPRVAQTTGMVIAYATAPGEVADDGAGDHSPFTKALIKHIRTPKRTIEQVLRDVATEVHSSTGGAQRPWVSASLLGGDLYLVPPGLGVGAGTTVPVRPAPSVAVPITRPATAARTPSRVVAPAPVKRAAPAARPARQTASRGGGGGGGGGGRASLPPGLGVGVGGGL